MAEAIIIPYEKGTCGKMTKEEALKLWLPIISMGIDNMPELKEALEMAIKALEQEPILDKIRAEIDAHREKLKIMADDDWYAGKIRGYDCSIEIIDKYKVESEERNEH